MSTFLSEDEVTIERIEEVFSGLLFDAHLDEDDDLIVRTDQGWRVVVSLDRRRKLVVFRAFFSFKEEADKPEVLELVNRLNDRVILARFSAPHDGILSADYFLPFERGLALYTIVRSFSWFNKVVAGGISQYDDDDIVQ